MINLLRTFTCHWGSIFSSFVELTILANSLWTLQWEKISQGEKKRIIFQHLSMYKYHVTIGRSSKSGSWLERIRHSLSQIWWQNSGFPLFEKVLSWIFFQNVLLVQLQYFVCNLKAKNALRELPTFCGSFHSIYLCNQFQSSLSICNLFGLQIDLSFILWSFLCIQTKQLLSSLLGENWEEMEAFGGKFYIQHFWKRSSLRFNDSNIFSFDSCHHSTFAHCKIPRIVLIQFHFLSLFYTFIAFVVKLDLIFC